MMRAYPVAFAIILCLVLDLVLFGTVGASIGSPELLVLALIDIAIIVLGVRRAKTPTSV